MVADILKSLRLSVSQFPATLKGVGAPSPQPAPVSDRLLPERETWPCPQYTAVAPKIEQTGDIANFYFLLSVCTYILLPTDSPTVNNVIREKMN
jgi:hypothetical protein